MKQGMVVLIIICMLTSNVGFASAAGAEDENFDSFFEQAVFFPVEFASRVYIDGTTHFMNGPVAQKDGVLYISMVMLEQLMGDQRVVFSGANEEGRIGYIQVPKGVMSWGYSEEDLLSFEAWVGKTECSVNGKAEVLSHAPYTILLENGTPYTMLPLKDVCRLLGKYYVEYDGLIVICAQKQELPPVYTEKLATIKKQLTQTFTGENMNYMQNTESGILFCYGENIAPLPGYQRYWIYALQNASGAPFKDLRTSEPISNVVRRDLISGETQQIAKVANEIRHNNDGEVYYLAASNIKGTALSDGYLLRMFYFGGDAMRSYDAFVYVGRDEQVIPLTEDEIVQYCFLDQEMYYLTRGSYFQSSVPGPGELYQVNLLQGTQQRIGREDMKYRQMEPLDANTFLLAALVGEEATTSYLYRFQFSNEEQVQLGKDEMMPLKMNDEKIIFFEYLNDRILYCSAKDRLLYSLSRDGRERKLLCSQPMGTNVQLKENCGFFIGDNGHLYQTLYDGAARDISGRKIRQYVTVGEQVFYICDGYQAGLYLWERGEKKLILAEKFKQIAADALGRVVVLPLDACAEYYVYEQGDIRQASLA